VTCENGVGTNIVKFSVTGIAVKRHSATDAHILAASAGNCGASLRDELDGA